MGCASDWADTSNQWVGYVPCLKVTSLGHGVGYLTQSSLALLTWTVGYVKGLTYPWSVNAFRDSLSLWQNLILELKLIRAWDWEKWFSPSSWWVYDKLKHSHCNRESVCGDMGAFLKAACTFLQWSDWYCQNFQDSGKEKGWTVPVAYSFTSFTFKFGQTITRSVHSCQAHLSAWQCLL